MSVYAIVETRSGRLVIMTPARALETRAVVVKAFDHYATAVRWARDEQITRDALRSINGRRWYYGRLIAGGVAVAALLSWCFIVGVRCGWPA